MQILNKNETLILLNFQDKQRFLADVLWLYIYYLFKAFQPFQT